MTDKNIYREAVHHYGELHQAGMAMEECAELIQAIHKVFYRAIDFDLASEIADVEIMLGQLRVMVGDDAVDAAKDKKLKRLRLRIEGYCVK